MIIEPQHKKYVVAVSFANYLENKSGIPKVMMAHQQLYNKNDVSYVVFFSMKKNIFHDKFMLFCKYGLIIDGKYQGIYQMSQIIKAFSHWENNGHRLIDIHIHHFMYNNIRLLYEMLDATPGIPIKHFLHDYYTMCSSFNLQKNDNEFCGGKGLNLVLCDGCAFYPKSKRNYTIHKQFLLRYIERIQFIAPSETTKNIFCNFYDEFREQIKVIPHQICVGNYTENLDLIKENEEIKVAFLGYPNKHKGWEQWSRLVKKFNNSKYKFFVFNSTDDVYEGMGKIKVSFSSNNLNAMMTALRDNKIHVAFLWSTCPETYSYTFYESLAANVYVITFKDSGNIKDTVRKMKCGLILSDEQSLAELFSEVEVLRDYINKYRLESSGGPCDLLDNQQIIMDSLEHEKEDEQGILVKWKPVNYPLLFLLNMLMGKRD